MNASNIRERMEVIGADGRRVGVVDQVEGDMIRLADDESPDGRAHYIPLDWVDRVLRHVHLRRACGEARRQWLDVPAGSAV